MINIQIDETQLFGGRPQEDGSLILVCKNNWFLRIDPKDPNATEWFTTVESGNPFTARKTFQVRMHDGPPWAQPLVEEIDLKQDKTVGGINPLVCVTPNGTFVAVQDKQRANGMVIEAFRKSWANPAEAPALTSNGGVVKNYTDKDLGRGIANDARIAAYLRLAQIKYELTVVYQTAVQLPEIDKGYWMEAETFVFSTLEHMGKGVFLVGVYAGHVPEADPIKRTLALSALPALIDKLSE